ncbi:MAG: hypothetical protein HKO66_15900 [Saprospiraceae bacterium]|nr:hypothetical protein [Bacteroidia bacterium]NNE16705.1 hypothetical protein [Saprospiraceae bacterium]NNL93726.1 hypothetical protein [Saprospiraceae bacterium]
MGNSNNIQEIQNRVSLFFDNALADKERQELLQQVNLDPRCSKIFNKEKNFREFIKNNVTRPTVSTDLIQNIKNKIRFI